MSFSWKTFDFCLVATAATWGAGLGFCV